MDRSELCRRLLGTATQIFLDNNDPVSVHTLAGTASEHSEYLAKQHTGRNFKTHVMECHPDWTESYFKKIRNRHYRVIKHSHDFKREPFDIDHQMRDFSDQQNDAVLFAGWYDFMKCGNKIPIAAQVFQLWFFRVYPSSMNPENDFDFPSFDGISEKPRFVQKQLLNSEISNAQSWKEVVEHPLTDLRPLILP